MTPQVISLSALGSTAWIPVDYKQNPFNISIACVVSDTPNLTYQVEFTLDDIFNPAITPTAFVHNTITGKTSDFSATQTQPVRAIRLTTTAYTSGTVTMTALQGGVNPIIYTPNPVTIFQSCIPFWLPPGDGGVNGLIFDGLRGTFTLSAAILTGFWNLVKAPAGGYCYLPAGAGGLVTGGLYFFRMTSDTTGEVFQDMYVPGSGSPAIPITPTEHPNLTATRITQTTAEVTAVIFTMPGGCLGPNGIIRGTAAQRGNNNAGVRSLRIKAGGTSINYTTIATSGMDLDYDFVRQNQGVQNVQIGNRTSNGWLGQAQSSISAEQSTFDTSVDQTITMTLQTDTTTNSILAWLREFTVKYGA